MQGTTGRGAAPPAAGPRRLWVALLLACLCLISAELLSFFALWWMEGRPLAVRSLAAERAQRIAEGAGRGVAGASAAPTAPLAPATGWRNLLDDPAHRQRVVHPYLGYVYDATLNKSASRRRAGYPAISPEGFYLVGSPAGAGEGEPAFTVAVFGGSMAMLFALEGGDALVRELAPARALSGRRIVLRCYALGGYKQPQQLLALTYLLSLGERPDLVVNLDGLNEVALPYAENRPRGVFPFFPRAWDALVQTATNPAALEEAGLVAYARARRVRLARLFSTPPLGVLASANLLWRALDRRLAREAAQANQALARLPAGPPGPAATGPPRRYASDDDLFADLVRSWRTSSLLMADLAAKNGIRYYHFLQPNQYDPGAKPISRAEAAVAIDLTSPFREPVRRGYPLLTQAGAALRQEGVRFFDLRPLFARIEKPLYTDTCCHVNREGSALLAQAIGGAIRRDLDGLPATGR